MFLARARATSPNIANCHLWLFNRDVMPLSKPVLIRLSNNGTGTMANWPRHISLYRLTPRVCTPLHYSLCPRLYSTAQEQLIPQSFAPRSDNGHANQGLQRRAYKPTTHGQILRASDLGGKFTDVEKAYGRLRIEASHGSNEGGLNATSIADHLVRVLGTKPDMRIYSSLILANCRPEGSVADVKALIQDLRADGFDLDSSTCHDVLKVSIAPLNNEG
jgi:hypothetical protein